MEDIGEDEVQNTNISTERPKFGKRPNMREKFGQKQKEKFKMRRLSDETFIKTKPEKDSVIGIRIKNGEFYFLGWMEDAAHYAIQIPCNVEKCQIERDQLMLASECMDVVLAIENTEGYNVMQLYWETDEDGALLNPDDEKFKDPYSRFLSFINLYERNGVSDPEDHDIFVTTAEEFAQVCDALRDGDYIFVFEDEDEEDYPYDVIAKYTEKRKNLTNNVVKVSVSGLKNQYPLYTATMEGKSYGEEGVTYELVNIIKWDKPTKDAKEVAHKSYYLSGDYRNVKAVVNNEAILRDIFECRPENARVCVVDR